MSWRATRALLNATLSEVDLIEFYGAEFWLPTWWLGRRPTRQRPLLVAHTDGLEPAAAERMSRSENSSTISRFLRRMISPPSYWAFTRSDAFVTASPADQEYAVVHDFYLPEQTAVIPLGLRPEYLAIPAPAPSSSDREDRIVFLGSWISRKGAAWVVETAGRLLKTRPALRLSLLGVGADEGEVRAAFPTDVQCRLDVRPRITLAENIEVLRRTKIFLLPSEYEGFGLALAEAMASGCAAVTTPTGFGAELRDGVEALICPFGDVIAMRAALERLLEDESLRVRIATAGQRRARMLCWKKSVDRLEETYLRWIEEKRLRSPF